jgi:hypothetical protein
VAVAAIDFEASRSGLTRRLGDDGCSASGGQNPGRALALGQHLAALPVSGKGDRRREILPFAPPRLFARPPRLTRERQSKAVPVSAYVPRCVRYHDSDAAPLIFRPFRRRALFPPPSRSPASLWHVRSPSGSSAVNS